MAELSSARRHLNWLSVAGGVLTTVSAALFVVFFGLDLAGFHINPYFGIVTFLLLPAAFVTGLALIPIGFWRERRRIARGMPARAWPTLDFNRPAVRRTAILVLALTVVNVAIVSMAGYKSVEYVDSTAFCSGVCHTTMAPESVAHRASVHASISCASCHVGPGAAGFVDAKLGGVRRLMAVTRGDVARPIPTPVRDLPSSRGTCAACHSADRYVGDKVKFFREYADDEDSTEAVTTLTLAVGGGGAERGGPHGIHWHASPSTRVEYVATDASRSTIPWVRVTDARGTREYMSEGVTAGDLAGGVRRVMDCTDCHNRVGHPLSASVEAAVDDALERGRLPRSLPFLRREAIAVAGADYPDAATAAGRIRERLTAFYAAAPEVASADPRIAEAAAATAGLYASHVFPAMGVTWGTYPSHRGHTESAGCFRCHDDRPQVPEAAAAGASVSPAITSARTISQDCETCHRLQ